VFFDVPDVHLRPFTPSCDALVLLHRNINTVFFSMHVLLLSPIATSAAGCPLVLRFKACCDHNALVVEGNAGLIRMSWSIRLVEAVHEFVE
jgi:hypothetical protein